MTYNLADSRSRFIVPLGAGRTEDGLTDASKERLDKAVRIAVEEGAAGIIALGDFFSTWRQGVPYDTPGAELRSNYLIKKLFQVTENEEILSIIKVIRIPKGACTLHELVAIRDLGFKYGIENILFITHPEHIPRVSHLAQERVFRYKLNGLGEPIRYRINVTSGNIPPGKLNIEEEAAYLKATDEYLLGKYPPDGVIPEISNPNIRLDPTIWWKEHAELYHSFRSIYDRSHQYRPESDFYKVSAEYRKNS